jgi:Transcriptional Coactivator p15 (PC4)
MKANAPPRANSATRDLVRANNTTPKPSVNASIPSACNSAQDQNQAVDIAHIGAIWKSPRDKRTCIQAGLKSYNGAPYCDLRVFEMDHLGRMRATAKGITISTQRLPQLAKLLGDAARKAHALGLTGASS